MYKTLADAASLTGNPAYGTGTTKVWYARPDFKRDAIMGLEWLREHGQTPSRSLLEATYVCVGTVNLDDPEDVWDAMQGERWSPGGQARSLIKTLGLAHTTLCVGDIAEINGQLWFCDNTGWAQLEG